MKLFNKARQTLPATRRPDYDSIAQMEKDARLDDNGFDERYDEMLLDEFKKRWAAQQWDEDKLESELYELEMHMTSAKYEIEVDSMIRDLHEERKIAGGIEFQRSCDNLRSIMMLNSRIRNS